MKLLYCTMLLLISCGSDKKHTQSYNGFKEKNEGLGERIVQIMQKNEIPGGVIGFSENENTVSLKSFGFIDKENEISTQNTSRFRIASISKPITAIGILKLVEQGKLKLGDNIVELLRHGGFATENIIDSNWEKITVENLLNHTGGWVHSDYNDPMFISKQISKEFKIPSPPSSSAVINYMLIQSLDYEPGTRYSYSNFGYNVLGRIIEIKTGLTYGEYIQEEVLTPLGISNTVLGKTKLSKKFKRESQYYDFPGASKVSSVYSDENNKVPRPQGGFYLEAMDSHGGWISTAEDLLQIIDNLETILKKETIDMMLSAPKHLETNRNNYYSMGWNVSVNNGRTVYWHTGSLPGTSATLVKFNADTSFVALFNSRDRNFTFLNEINDVIVNHLENRK
ncbi:MAG: beta-lactamase family protein [Flavobacteriales bacterium]|nr:beta-lactamase family protein [Flavobacteriales bacterium]